MNLVYILTWIVLSYNHTPIVDTGKYKELGIYKGFSSEQKYYCPQSRKTHELAFKNKDSLKSFIKKIHDFKQNGMTVSSDVIEIINTKTTELK